MTTSANNKAISKSFSDAVDTYEHWALPQYGCARRLMELLPEQRPVHSAIDIGCGTGFLTELIRDQYPCVRILGIDVAPGMIESCRSRWPDDPAISFEAVDAETYNASDMFDLIASSFSFQWFTNPKQTISQFAGILNPEGVFALAVPVHESLSGLRDCYQEVVGTDMPGIDFLSSDHYEEAFNKSGLTIREKSEEDVETFFESGLEALRSFKATGTSFQYHADYTPLSADETRKLVQQYEESFKRSDGHVPVIFRVLYLIGEKTS